MYIQRNRRQLRIKLNYIRVISPLNKRHISFIDSINQADKMYSNID